MGEWIEIIEKARERGYDPIFPDWSWERSGGWWTNSNNVLKEHGQIVCLETF